MRKHRSGKNVLGERVRLGLRTLLEKKDISRSRATRQVVIKELDGAVGDLEAAKLSLKTGDYKWATIQAYYSMFHAARALLFRMGYREQSDPGLLAALYQLYEREIVDRMLEDFSKAMALTEQAHDGHVSSEDSAQTILENAADFLEQAARLLAAPREWFERPPPRRRVNAKKRRTRAA